MANLVPSHSEAACSSCNDELESDTGQDEGFRHQVAEECDETSDCTVTEGCHWSSRLVRAGLDVNRFST